MILARLQRLAPRERVALLLAVGAVVVWLLDLLVVNPLMAEIESLDAEIESAELTLKYNRNTLKWSDPVDREYQGIRDVVGETTTPAQDIERLTTQVDALARSTGIKIPSMGGTAPPDEKDVPYAEYAVEVRSLEADLVSLLTFLYECPQQSGLLRVDSISVAPNEASGLLEGSMVVTKVMLKPLQGAE